MKKRLIAFMVALVLLTLPAGCSGSQEPDYDPAEIAASILEDVNFSNDLTLAEGAALENLYALGDTVTDYAIYYDAGAFSAEEVAVLKAKSAESASGLEDVLNTRLENLAFAFESYNPGEMQKIDNPVIYRKGNIAVMVLSNDAAAQEKVAALFA